MLIDVYPGACSLEHVRSFVHRAQRAVLRRGKQYPYLGVIAARGGFTERAWKKKVLIVRGSLNQPETFVVDAAAVLSARAADFKLEPRDIVYVHSRPWIRAEELLDTAVSAFVQAAVITWTGGHIGPLIRSPIIE